MSRAGLRVGVASVVVAAAFVACGIAHTAEAFVLLAIVVSFASAGAAIDREMKSRHRVRDWVDAIRAERGAATHPDPSDDPDKAPRAQ